MLIWFPLPFVLRILLIYIWWEISTKFWWGNFGVLLFVGTPSPSRFHDQSTDLPKHTPIIRDNGTTVFTNSSLNLALVGLKKFEAPIWFCRKSLGFLNPNFEIHPFLLLVEIGNLLAATCAGAGWRRAEISCMRASCWRQSLILSDFIFFVNTPSSLKWWNFLGMIH